MDDFTIHIAAEPREHPFHLQVSSVGFMEQKDQLVSQSFTTLNFSLILKGCGKYLWQGQWVEVEAPCVLTQWPGLPMEYGPDERGWTELYIIYQREALTELERQRFASRQRPVFAISSDRQAHFVGETQRFLERWNSRQQSPDADALDRDCERLLFEAHKGIEAAVGDRDSQTIASIRNSIEERLFEWVDLAEIAGSHRMSPSRFRRFWERFHDTPPWSYVLIRRLQKACRLLAETDLRINEIAWRCGFEDPQYFSRKFSKQFRYSPKAYRKRFYAR